MVTDTRIYDNRKTPPPHGDFITLEYMYDIREVVFNGAAYTAYDKKTTAFS
jgi:hypothetical protein